MSKPEAGDRQIVTALARGLDILRCFDRPGLELTVSAIARRTGLNQPTTWRLCNTLIDGGFLVRSLAGPALRVGAPALTLGYAAINGLDLPAIALPYMEQVTRRTGGSTTLSRRVGIEMISIARRDAEMVLPNEPVGWRAALTSGPSGLAVLASLDDAAQADALAELEAHNPSGWRRRHQRVMTAIAQYHRDGCVTLSGMLDGQYAAVAVPIAAGAGATIHHWAIGCGGLQARWDETRLSDAAGRLREVRSLLLPAAAVLA